jgi:branched-chain amino acid transport system permease protein
MFSKREASVARTLLTSGVGSLVVLLLPLVFPTSRDLSTLSYVAIFGLVAYSLSVSFRFAGVLMLGQGAVWGVGAYTATLLHNNHGWSTWAVLPAAALTSAVSAVVIGAVALRARGHYFLIVTFVMNELIVLGAGQVDFTGGQQGLLMLDPPNSLGPLSFDSSEARFYLYAAFLIVGMFVVGVLAHTSLGQRMVSIRESEDLARSVSISVVATKLQAFALGGALAGIAGVLYAYHQVSVAPQLFSTLTFLQMALMLIIGGSATLLGPVVGAFLLLYLPQWLSLSPAGEQVAYGVLLIVIMLVAPRGIVGSLSQLPHWLRRWRERGSPNQVGGDEELSGDARPRSLTGKIGQ